MDPKVADPQYKRRCDPRYGIRLDATVQIPVDEEPSAFLKIRASIVDVSIMGLHVYVRRLKAAHVPLVERVGWECSVLCKFPDTSETAFLSGKIAWVEVSTEGPAREARFGLTLTDTIYREHYRLLRLIDRLRGQSTGAQHANDQTGNTPRLP